MRIADIPKFVETVEEKLMHIPETESGEIVADLIEFTLERINNTVFDFNLNTFQINQCVEMIRSAFRNFDIFI